MKWTWHQGHTWKTSEVYSLPASYFFPAFSFLPLSKVRHLRRYFGFTQVFTPIWFIMQKWILEWNIHWEFLWLSARSVWRQSMVCLFGVKSCQLWYGSQLVWKQHTLLAKLANHCPALTISSSFMVAHITNSDSYPWELVCLMVYTTFLSRYLNIITPLKYSVAWTVRWESELFYSHPANALPPYQIQKSAWRVGNAMPAANKLVKTKSVVCQYKVPVFQDPSKDK